MTVRMDIHGARRKREEEQKPKPNGEAAPAPLLRADNIGARPCPGFGIRAFPPARSRSSAPLAAASKGLNAAHYTACLTTGTPWPDGTTPATTGHVLWCETEDPLPEVVVPRFIAAGADRTRIEFASRQAFADLGDGLRAIPDEIDLLRIALWSRSSGNNCLRS